MHFYESYGAPIEIALLSWGNHELQFETPDGRRWMGRFNGRWFEGDVRTPGSRQFSGDNVVPGGFSHWTAVRQPVARAGKVH